MLHDGSKVIIKNQKFIESLEINDCVGFEGEDDSMLPYIKNLASRIGEIEDGYFDEYDAVWVNFGGELLVVVPKTDLEEVA